MKSRKLFSISLLACTLTLLIFAFIGVKPRADTFAEETELTGNIVLVGEDSEKLYNLSIDLKVFYDLDTELYTVAATAKWQKAGAFTKGKKRAENLFCDYVTLSWGGSGALCAESVHVNGTYSNGSNVDFVTRISDSYSEFTWQFDEKFKSSRMSCAGISFNLRKVEENVDEEAIVRETSLQMSYVHTYGRSKVSVPIIFGKGLSSDKISFSKMEEFWKIGISVTEIKF